MHILLILSILISPATAERIEVRTDLELTAAFENLLPGTEILLHPGEYRGGYHLRNIHGTADDPITIGGGEPSEVVFRGGTTAIQLSACSHITLRGFTVTGFPGNGINADDGENFSVPSQHLRFEDLVIERTGPIGNHDSLKLSGVVDFQVRRCTFAGWGGSAIDMVGCHRGKVDESQFTGVEDHTQHSGIQIKGGSSDIRVTRSHFHKAGSRAINLGGSTGLAYFRPQDAPFEAKDVIIAGNRFEGSEAPIAWVGSVGGRVEYNTFWKPGKWVGRILQEQKGPRFLPCSEGVFSHNLVVFDDRVKTFINVGPETRPETFAFHNNVWVDSTGAGHRPILPATESEGIYATLQLGDRPLDATILRDCGLGAVGQHAFKGY